MVADPAETPITTPVVAFTEATAGLLLLHVPPMLPLLVKLADKPAQILAAPVIVPETASGLTVTK